MSNPQQYSDEDEHPGSAPPEAVLKTYGVYNTGSRINFRIHEGGSSGPCVYYINNSTFTPGSPDVQIRAGDSKDGPIVAFGKFHNLSGHVTLGIGNPDKDDKVSVVYEELHKESRLTHSEYVLETDFAGDQGRRKYIWRRTIGKGLFANYACMDAGSGKLMAYFAKTGKKSLKKVGRLCITAPTRPEFDQMLLVSWLAIREKENRNAWYVGGAIGSASGAP